MNKITDGDRHGVFKHEFRNKKTEVTTIIQIKRDEDSSCHDVVPQFRKIHFMKQYFRKKRKKKIQ